MEKYTPGIGYAAGVQMIKWITLEDHIYREDKIKLYENDKVDVFINFEMVLRNLSMRNKLNELITFHKQSVVLELESAILNLVANYKAFFHKQHVDPYIYLYYNDLLCNDDQQMTTYNKFYRSYYKNKYLQNPQFKTMGRLMADTIIPEVELILSYVNHCYFVKASTFDSSLIPLIISNDNNHKSIIISSDVFDTLYFFKSEFIPIYIKRRYNDTRIISDIESSMQSIIVGDDQFNINIFMSELYYKLLLSIKGSRIRNIKSAKGFGYIKFKNILNDGLINGIILKDFNSIHSVLELFPEKYRKDIYNAFVCTDLDTQYALLSDADKEFIKMQLIDKEDDSSLESLNNKRFLEYPINLQYLMG